MIVTGNVRQGVKQWPQDKNMPGKELLGRYDLYPHPSGKESLGAVELEVTLPPTDAPQHPAQATQPGSAGMRYGPRRIVVEQIII